MPNLRGDTLISEDERQKILKYITNPWITSDDEKILRSFTDECSFGEYSRWSRLICYDGLIKIYIVNVR